MNGISWGKNHSPRRFGGNLADSPLPETDAPTPKPTETEPPELLAKRAHRAQKNPLALSRWVLAFALILIAAFFLLFFPYPVVINSPGPTFDVLGKNDGDIPLIEVKGAKTYPNNNGELRMTTVSTLGGPGSMVNGLDVIGATFDKNSEILPVELVYPKSLTSKDIETIGVRQMDQSQLAAEAVALQSLGYKVEATWSVAEIPKEAGAFGILENGDVLETIRHGEDQPLEITTIETLRDYLATIPAKTEVTLSILRDGNPLEVTFPTMKNSQGKGSQLGILLDSKVNVPLDIKFHLQDVGGPSAGAMFALGIVEQLTPEKITSNHPVAGTGTIDLSGAVGPISGIAQKMAGARADGAEFFLAPAANCDEVDGHIPAGLKVTPVATFDDALRALKTIREDAGKDLPSCPSRAQK
ncbi:MAG: peptidase S16 [Mobiluncus sp.]|uniref:YlbL family protein n=1 Tax=Mobiluncus sp. TaxID=47293 RepID=UPI002585FE93|nr:S16 family serine protease [Mobiluncus sp.]MCI6584325.1 peptidase S16 [Mobiluncus sp.]